MQEQFLENPQFSLHRKDRRHLIWRPCLITNKSKCGVIKPVDRYQPLLMPRSPMTKQANNKQSEEIRTQPFIKC